MKICLYPYTEGAGTGMYIIELAHALKDLGHDVVVIGKAKTSAERHRLRFIQTPTSIKSQYSTWYQLPPLSYLDPLSSAQSLQKIIAQEKPDIIHLSTHVDPRLLGIPSVVTAWDYPKSFQEAVKLAHRYSPWYLLLFRILREIEMSWKDKKMFERVNRIIGINQEVTRHLQKQGLPVYYLPPGIKANPILPKKNSTLTLCFIARNHIWIKRKGLMYFLNALLEIQKNEPAIEYQVHIIGRIPWHHSWKIKKYKSLLNSLIFHGLLSRDQTMNIIAQSHIQVIPSVYEEFGYAALEAMSLGTAIVVSEGNNSFEEMVSEDAGISVDVFNAPKFARALLPLLKNKKIRLQYSRMANAKVMKSYNRESIAKKLIDQYKRVTKTF